MNISIICIGKLKEDYWKAAVNEYSKRLSRFCRLEIIELAESKSDNISDIINDESRQLLLHIPKGSYVFALDIGGKSIGSEALAEKIGDLAVSGKSSIAFIIGGSDGFNDDVRKASDFRLSFSSFTFPHQMMRVILLEQIYRAFKINAGEKYHK